MHRLSLACALCVGLLLPFASCSEDGEVGAPCNVDGDCAEGLICDLHDGAGSCQQPHNDSGHDTGHASTGDDTEHASTGHDTEDTEHGSGTGHDSTGTAGSSGETGASTGAGTSTGAGG